MRLTLKIWMGAAALGLFGLSGCATVTRGTKDAFVVNTDPAGARVTTSNGYSCDPTPCTIKMPRRSDFTVTISREGYETWTGQVTSAISGAGGLGMAGNLVLGGIVGAGVDLATGAMNDLTPNPLTVTMSPTAGAAAPAVAVAPQAPAPVAVQVVPVAVAAPAPVVVQAAPIPVVVQAAPVALPAPAPVVIQAAPAPVVLPAPIHTPAPVVVQAAPPAPVANAPRGYAAPQYVSPPRGYAGYPSQSLQTGSIQIR